jgi:hypothetical protein
LDRTGGGQGQRWQRLGVGSIKVELSALYGENGCLHLDAIVYRLA